MSAHIPLLGLVGGIASGKSVIAQQLEALGAAVISADRLAHDVLKQDEVKREVRSRWGDEIFAADGEIHRPALAKIVFAPPPTGPAELKYLEQLTHPRIGVLSRQELDRLRQARRAQAIVLDVPLLFESGWDKSCDRIVFVDAPHAVRLQRALARGWTAEQFDRREAAQESVETKRKRADFVIDNSGSLEMAASQCKQFWHDLLGFAPNEPGGTNK